MGITMKTLGHLIDEPKDTLGTLALGSFVYVAGLSLSMSGGFWYGGLFCLVVGGLGLGKACVD